MKEFPTIKLNPIELSVGQMMDDPLYNLPCPECCINGLLSKREDCGWFEEFILESGNFKFKIMVIPGSEKSRRLKRMLHRRVNIIVERSDV